MKLFFPAILLFLSLYLTAAPQELVIGCDYFPPYVINVKKEVKLPGFAVELCRKLLPEKEFRTVFRNCSWHAGIGRISRKELDGFLMMAPADSPELVYPKEPIAVIRPSLWSIKKIDFPEKKKSMLAVRRDHFFSDEAEALAKEYDAEKKLLPSDNPGAERSFRNFLQKKAPLIIEDYSFMAYRKMQTGKRAQDWVCLKILGSGTPFYIAFSNRVGKGWQARSVWDRNFRKFSRTKEYQELLKKYGLPETFETALPKVLKKDF